MKALFIFLYFVLWLLALADLRQWKRQDFRTDIKTNEGNFFSFWLIGNVVFLFIYALKAFMRAY